MKTFKTLSDVGRGRLVYQSKLNKQLEELYLATTNEQVLCCGEEETILPSQEAAIKWAVDNDLCAGKLEFLQRCTEVVRIPFGTTTPKVRPLCDERNRVALSINPEVRIEELIQHPIYNTCVVKDEHAELAIRLTDKQRKKVVRYVKCIFDVDYYSGERAHLQNGNHIGYTDNQLGIQKFHAFSPMSKSQMKDLKHLFHMMPLVVKNELETFSVFTGRNLPSFFKNRDFDEVTWLKIDSKNSHGEKTLKNFALMAIAVNVHYQMNYEFNQRSTSMDPMETLQGLGMRPYEKPEALSLHEKLINFLASRINP